MNTATHPSKILGFDSTGRNRSTKNTNSITRFWNRLTEGVGTGYRKPANYSSMSQGELEQRAAEDMAIAKAMGFGKLRVNAMLNLPAASIGARKSKGVL